jgi:hypothetical protein
MFIAPDQGKQKKAHADDSADRRHVVHQQVEVLDVHVRHGTATSL